MVCFRKSLTLTPTPTPTPTRSLITTPRSNIWGVLTLSSPAGAEEYYSNANFDMETPLWSTTALSHSLRRHISTISIISLEDPPLQSDDLQDSHIHSLLSSTNTRIASWKVERLSQGDSCVSQQVFHGVYDIQTGVEIWILYD